MSVHTCPPHESILKGNLWWNTGCNSSVNSRSKKAEVYLPLSQIKFGVSWWNSTPITVELRLVHCCLCLSICRFACIHCIELPTWFTIVSSSVSSSYIFSPTSSNTFLSRPTAFNIPPSPHASHFSPASPSPHHILFFPSNITLHNNACVTLPTCLKSPHPPCLTFISRCPPPPTPSRHTQLHWTSPAPRLLQQLLVRVIVQVSNHLLLLAQHSFQHIPIKESENIVHIDLYMMYMMLYTAFWIIQLMLQKLRVSAVTAYMNTVEKSTSK